MPTFFRPETDYGRRLITFQDAIEHLTDYSHNDATGEVERYGRRAVLRAYDEMGKQTWNYYQLLGRLVTVASYTTGTIEYDHTGGTYERMITLTTGTWPSWAADGVVRISNNNYRIDERKSDSIVTLKSTENPGADVASGTTYTIYQDQYRLPGDFQEASSFIIPQQTFLMNFVSPSHLSELQSIRWGPNTPYHYTIIGDQDYYGAMSVLFFPPPDAAYQIDYLYKRHPRPLRIYQYSTGSATTAADSTTITGIGTSWTSSMIGSVIRFSENTTTIPTGSGGINPAHTERIVTAVASATSLTVDRAVDDTLTGVKYSISDIVDIDQNSMLTYFFRECEKQVRIIRRMKETPQEREDYNDAYHMAREADSRSYEARAAGTLPRWPSRLADMPLES